MATKKSDQTTLKLIEEVKKQKEEISRAERPVWKTTLAFSYTGNPTGATNLHTVSSIEELVSIVAFLLDRSNSYSKASEMLGVKSEFKWQGFSLNDWIDDIKTRMDKIQISGKKKKLEVLEVRLNAVISPELKAQMELEAIAQELA
jgi:hypothetical protein